MKGSRNELAFSTLGKYLKRRQYTDNEVYKKSELKLHQTLQEMSLQGIIQTESGVRNAISLSSISGDATAIDQQFTRLKTFISESSEPFKSELTYLLYPMFVHLYLELISNGQKTAAQKFHSRHHSLFLQTEHYKSVVEILPKILSMQDLSNHPDVKEFRENKYTARLSDECVEYLMRFLKETDHLILMQLMNLYIDAEIHCPDYQSRLHLYEDEAASGDKAVHKTSDSSEKTDKSSSVVNDAVSELKQIIKKVRDGPPCLPSVSLYTLSNVYQGLCRVALSPDNSLLIGGCENSSICMWSLIPNFLTSQPGSTNISHIYLAPDAVEDEEEDNGIRRLHNKPVYKVMRGHGGAVYGLSFVPQSDVLLSCSEDTTVRAWNLKSHSNVSLYRGHGYPVWDIDASSLGTYFATASMDHTARLWSLDRTYPLRILAGHNGDVDCVKFHPNSNYIATGSSDRTVRLWDVQSGRMVRTFSGHRATIFSLAFSPNGQLLASAGEDRRIKIWDLASGSQVRELRGHTEIVYSMCFNGDSSVLASGGLEHALRLWDVRRGVSHGGSHANSSSSSSSTSNVTPGNAPSGTPLIESHTSPELLAALPTKSVSLHLVQYTAKNLLQAVGTLEPVTTTSQGANNSH